MFRKKDGMLMISVILIVLLAVAALIIYDQYKRAVKEELFDAIESNDIETVRAVLDKWPSLVSEEQFGTGIGSLLDYMFEAPTSPPLSVAIQFRRNDIAKLLVERGADVNDRKYDPLYSALWRGNYEIVWYLIENGADITATNVDGYGVYATFLQAVAGSRVPCDDTDRAQQLLELFLYGIENGAPQIPLKERFANGTYYNGVSSLFGMAVCDNNYRIVEYCLQELSQDVNECITESDKTALICAVEHQAYNVCEILLSHGADKCLLDADGKNALYYAIQLQDEKLIEMLQD